MYKIRLVLLLFGSFILFRSFGQNFVLQESNLDEKKNSQYFATVKKCESVLLKKEPISSLPFSSKSTLTNNYLKELCDKFPQLRPSGEFEKVINRDFRNAEKIIKLTYTYVAPDKNETTKYIQLFVQFDKSSTSPKIVDLQLKTPADVGIITLSSKEADRLRKKPEPPAPKNVTKAPAKTTPKAPSKTPIKTAPKTPQTTPAKTAPKPQPKTPTKTSPKTQPKTPTKTAPQTTPPKTAPKTPSKTPTKATPKVPSKTPAKTTPKTDSKKS
ncbi:MAG: hypothetical protein HY015_01950 [Bacteroidetes bacterium]|nr:hypothetical protein [Bacteroidota bacterium]